MRFGVDPGHTRTHADEVAGEICLLPLTHPGILVLPQGSGQLCSARGPSEVNCPSLVRDGHEFCYFCMFLLLGFLVEETPCEHGENMQTPHRKAREIAHLSTLGRTCPPEPTAPHVGIEPMTFLL